MKPAQIYHLAIAATISTMAMFPPSSISASEMEVTEVEAPPNEKHYIAAIQSDTEVAMARKLNSLDGK